MSTNRTLRFQQLRDNGYQRVILTANNRFTAAYHNVDEPKKTEIEEEYTGTWGFLRNENGKDFIELKIEGGELTTYKNKDTNGTTVKVKPSLQVLTIDGGLDNPSVANFAYGFSNGKFVNMQLY
ncbi:TIM8 [Acrasis kona]|uniref:TIM8 n=1 Tax=Acrasis kona TaxID=1008807 RepID=A0AAW2Z7W6_9EUKA